MRTVDSERSFLAHARRERRKDLVRLVNLALYVIVALLLALTGILVMIAVWRIG